MDQFVASGGNFIDTADVYQYGLSEKIIGTWLAKQPANLRKKLILATKLCAMMDRSDANALGLTRHHIMESIEGSLSRLQTSYVDIYQVNDELLHGTDNGTYLLAVAMQYVCTCHWVYCPDICPYRMYSNFSYTLGSKLVVIHGG